MDKDKSKKNRSGQYMAKPKPEYEQKIISIRRVTRVVAGGRRFSFSVALVAGDQNGVVGLGLGKAGDTALAINKALRDAKKHMIKINLNEQKSIPHEISAKFSSAKVIVMPNKGRGLVAGTVARDIIKLAGAHNVTAKIVSSGKNRLNNAKAVMKAFSQIGVKYTKTVKEEKNTDNSEVKINQA